MKSALATLVTFLFLGLLGCEEEERPGLFQGPTNKGGAGGDSSVEDPDCEKPPEIDKSYSCGEETVRLFERKPTIYFVLDISGSMANRVLRGNDSKLDAAKTALTTVATEIGHRVKYGLTAFPGPDDFDLGTLAEDDPIPLLGCEPGEEVFPVQAGDPIECLNQEPNGPVLRDFQRTVRGLDPIGGTPLSPTLTKLTPTVLGLEGLTSVILVTDGSPNCNAGAECGTDECALNLSGRIVDEVACDDDFNCCDPENVSDILDSAGGYCVDSDASVAAIARLAKAGINTYVIGVLGEEDFDDAMNALAEAGGKARGGDRKYYDVETLDELTEAVRSIGSEVAQNCELELLERPSTVAELNVYFDGIPVPQDDKDGWTFNGNDLISLNGDACDELQSGSVTEIQLISGCETIIR